MWLPERARRNVVRASLLLVMAGPALVLGGCQFRPLYGTASPSGSVATDLSTIRVAETGHRVAQLVRNRLISTMSPPGSRTESRYRLELSTDSDQRDVFVRSNTDVTRQNYTLSVEYHLYEIGSNRLVYRGSTFSIVSYDRVTSQFANVRALKDAEQRASRQVADDIRTDLAARVATL